MVSTGGDIGDAMVSHPVPSVVSFTGSTSVGEGIVKTAGIKRLSLELGGNGPLVVLDDADLDDANAAFGGVRASGIGRFGGRWAIEEFTTDHWGQRAARTALVPDPLLPPGLEGNLRALRNFVAA